MDWSSEATQELRFEQLLRICDFRRPMTLDDWGCGYGALTGYLARRYPRAAVDYVGIDLSREMVAQARRLWRGKGTTKFRTGRRSPRVADYAVASGIFNVKLDAAVPEWEALVAETLREMHARCAVGFAVNFLAPWPAHLPQPPQLYRCPADRWHDFCVEELDADVQIRCGYGLNEYTLLVKRR